MNVAINMQTSWRRQRGVEFQINLPGNWLLLWNPLPEATRFLLKPITEIIRQSNCMIFADTIRPRASFLLPRDRSRPLFITGTMKPPRPDTTRSSSLRNCYVPSEYQPLLAHKKRSNQNG